MQARRVTFYLPETLRDSAQAGSHNFIGKVARVLADSGFSPVYADESGAADADPDEYAVVHMNAPPHDRALTIRRVYHYPFWAIEITDRRWAWTVARTAFDPGLVDRTEADGFRNFWRKRLFGEAAARRDGFIYLPLQGLLGEQRSFQTCSPLEMVETALDLSSRPIVATLHPNESYGRRELAALDRLVRAHPRLTLEIGGMAKWLAGCDMVVTQNSSAGFNGFFFGKPCILFGRVDFHHIAANVADLGAAGAFDAVQSASPDYAGYIHWFWQRMSINAGRPEGEQAIRAALLRGGWPV